MENILKYNISKIDKIKLFGEEFVKNNKGNLLILINDEEYELNVFFDLSGNHKKEKYLEIKVKLLNNLINISYMFSGCKQLVSAKYLSLINTDDVVDMSFMFSNCSSLSSLPDISKWNISQVKNMESMFEGCLLLKSCPEISTWNVSNVKNMKKLFYGCSSLLSLSDISKWDTSNINNMKGMFQGCSLLSTLPDISKWNISKVKNTNSMFYGCQSLTSFPDISIWNTKEIIDMSFMFYNCSKLSSFPDISNWNIENLKKYQFMFIGCSLLKNIPSFSKKVNIDNLSEKSNGKEKEKEKHTKISNNNSIKRKNTYEIYENNYYFCCYICQKIPEVLLEDEKNFFLSCINCGNGESINIENIINGSSKWIKKIIYFCNNHKEKIDANFLCKECELLLCKNCYKNHNKKESNHTLINLINSYINFCEDHNLILSYYCINCNYEICKECQKAHNNHKIKEINDDCSEIINSNTIKEFEEKIKEMNLYEIAQDTIETLLKYKTIDYSLKFTESKIEIMKLLQNDIKKRHNLLILSKILFFSSHKIKNNRFELIENYKDFFKAIRQMFSQKDIEKFKKIINYHKYNYIITSKKLSNNEENELNENIKNIFKPMSIDISDLEKKKKFIENNIIYTDILKRYIINDKAKNPDNYIDIEETINEIDNINNNMNSKENPEFILSILGKCIEKNGNQVYISKTKNKKFDNIELASIHSLISLGKEKKYEIHFDFGEEKNNVIFNNSFERENFIHKWKEKISENLKIDINNLILTNIHHGSIRVDASIINGTEKEEKALLELEGKSYIKKIEEKPLLEALEISPEILDPNGDRNQGWGVDETRGGEKYLPPLNGWYGLGLKVKDKYDNGDNSWLNWQNKKREFAIAYLGISNFLNEKERIVGDLNNASRNIKNFVNQRLYREEENIRAKGFLSNLINSKCGDGVCLFQNPEYAENSAGIVEVCGYRIKIILMCRVNSKKIRQPKTFRECWILNPTPDEVRPYRILIKKMPISPLAGALNDKIVTTISPINYILSAIKSNDLSFHNLVKDNRFKEISIINNQLVPKDLFAIRLYSSEYYKFINEYLRTEKILDNYNGLIGFSQSEIKSWICSLHLALKKNKNVANNTIVYRGVSPFKFPLDIGIGSKFYFREFVSTSLNKKIAENFIINLFK